MESHHRLNAVPGASLRSPALPSLLRLASCTLLAGLLLGCAAQSKVEPIPLPEPAPQPESDPPKGDGKGWKPVTG